MDDYYWYRRSGQIPAFGNWDYANEMPITQYFDCARQAGMLRYSSSGDLYDVDFIKPSKLFVDPLRKTAGRGRGNSERRSSGSAHLKDHKMKQQSKVCDVTEQPRKLNPNKLNGTVRAPPRRVISVRAPKAVDEDLYKIPPELLHTSKRKKMLGFFSRCLVPACRV